jgi:hypothetical protein
MQKNVLAVGYARWSAPSTTKDGSVQDYPE